MVCGNVGVRAGGASRNDTYQVVPAGGIGAPYGRAATSARIAASERTMIAGGLFAPRLRNAVCTRAMHPSTSSAPKSTLPLARIVRTSRAPAFSKIVRRSAMVITLVPPTLRARNSATWVGGPVRLAVAVAARFFAALARRFAVTR